MKIYTLLIFTTFYLNFAVLADDNNFCAKGAEIKKLASASTWQNLRNNEGSLKFEINQILNSALKNLPDSQKLVIRSSPKKTLTDSDDSDYCQKKLAETTKSPLRYSPKVFTNVENLNDWIGDFSQGRGTEGSDLYAKCDRDCSPQYQYSITNSGKNLKLDVDVVCGLPRDKDDNQYVVKAQCVAK